MAFFLLFIFQFTHAQEIKNLSEAASIIEDKLADECIPADDPDPIDQKANLPKDLKESGWKVLFEVKYNSINKEDVFKI